MRRLFVAAALCLSACQCDTHARDFRYSCNVDSDCANGNSCVNGECTNGGAGGGNGGGAGGGTAGAGGSCVPGAPPVTCAITACQQTCQSDGGYSACAPKTGLDLLHNPEHCGQCGRACSTSFNGALGCIGGFCSCTNDADCPSGTRCNASGLCVELTDPCGSVRCDAGTVCRMGSCNVSPCDMGCAPGEVCNNATGLCRPIATCKLPAECGDGTICEGPPKPEGAPCDDSEGCTFSDVCTGGTCAGTFYSCNGMTPGQCQMSLYCAGDGGCAAVPAVDGTVCDDGNACTFADSCDAGACSGTGYVCPTGLCATAASCNGDGGCTFTAQNEGTACDDNNLCSVNDVCTQGRCLGNVYTCPMAGPCEQGVACTGDGGCVFTTKPNGAMCEDGEACTAGDYCDAGACSSGPVGTTYRDLDGDGRGDLNISSMVCPTPAGYVGVGGDCNDGDPDVYTFVQNLLQDADGDGRTTGVAMGQCVGATTVMGGRTYYADVMGRPTWLASTASLGADCNDGDPDVFESLDNAVTDSDNDGYYSGASGTLCVGATRTVNGRTYYINASGQPAFLLAIDALGSTECNDSNFNVYRTVTAAGTDVDQDGYVVPNTGGSQCVGASATVNTRVYYANTSGLLTWLVGTALGTDCNDMNAATSGPFPWYYDFDRDTYGGPNSVVACATPDAGYVVSTGDCDDMNVNVFRTGVSVLPDDDKDGWQNGGSTVSTAVCVGNSSLFAGRTYYKGSNGQDTWLSSTMTLGSDCSNSDPNLFASMANIVTDADSDGYYSGAPSTVCVGAAVANNGRTYYRNSAGQAVYLLASAALGSTECNDSNGLVFQTQVAGTDVDQDGYTVMGSRVSQCVGASMIISGRTYYADSSGAFTRMGSAELGTDCNDNNAGVSGPFPWYLDSDGDGTGGTTSQVSCSSPGAGYVVTGGDCDDTNGSIYRTVTVGLVVDGDRDGYKELNSTSNPSVCVGVTTMNGGRTYYRNSAGADTWLTASQSLGNDCNDASAAVLGPTAWYLDVDGDTYGAGAPLSQCAQPAGYVASGTDCNDSPAGGQYVFHYVSTYDDTDRDGYTDSVQGFASRCVGGTQTYQTRTYYQSTSGAYTWIASSYGVDCLDTNANVFQVVGGLDDDADTDGYVPADAPFSACVGAASSIAGRTYYNGPTGTPVYIDERDCLTRQGMSCRPPYDCYDLNGNARPGQVTAYAVNRGDGSFDYDCSGSGTPVASGSYCASVTATTFYTDAACSMGAAAGNICNTPTSYTSGVTTAACGKYRYLAVTGFQNPAACSAVPRADATQVTCR